MWVGKGMGGWVFGLWVGDEWGEWVDGYRLMGGGVGGVVWVRVWVWVGRSVVVGGWVGVEWGRWVGVGWWVGGGGCVGMGGGWVWVDKWVWVDGCFQPLMLSPNLLKSKKFYKRFRGFKFSGKKYGGSRRPGQIQVVRHTKYTRTAKISPAETCICLLTSDHKQTACMYKLLATSEILSVVSELDRLMRLYFQVVYPKVCFPWLLQRSDSFDVNRKYLVAYTWAGGAHLLLTSVTQGRSLDGSIGAVSA